MRDKHTFVFPAQQIADAALLESQYHQKRAAYWEQEYQKFYALVAVSAGFKLEKQAVTGGHRTQVVATYDYAAFNNLHMAEAKIEAHLLAADKYEIDAALYASQSKRLDERGFPATYELTVDDVHYYRLAGEEREE